jgi:hypothetical protein
MATDHGITVGSTRADVMAAYPDGDDVGSEYVVAGFRIGIEDDVVTWLGDVQCGD